MCLFSIAKGDELLFNFFIIQERKFVFTNCYALTGAGVLVQLVVIAEITLVEHLVHGFTTLATKVFVGELYCFVDAFITTVIAFYCSFYSRVHNRLQIITGLFAAF